MSKIILLQRHWLAYSKTGLLFEGHLPFQSFLPKESGSSHIQATTSVLSPRPMHYIIINAKYIQVVKVGVHLTLMDPSVVEVGPTL
jgi:hypothetical protein